MDMERFVTIISVVLVCALIFFGLTPAGRSMWNDYEHDLEKADENQYEDRKKVEDTARAMIANYEADVQTYNLWKDSDDEDEQSWAKQAMMRANRTAASYNNYILENSYVWADNVPDDIDEELPYIGLDETEPTTE